MKKGNYIKIALSSLAVMSMLSSCLKDTPTTVDFTKATGSLELPAVAYSGTEQAAVFDIAATPTALPLMVNLSGPHPAPSNTTVTLAVQDQAALDAYNDANDTDYELLPAADYSIASLTVTIPSGQRQANLNIAINTSLIDLSKSYALPITIANGGGLAINPLYKTVIYAVQVKNKYDGRYTLTGTLTDVLVPTITGKYPLTVDLATKGANSVLYTEGGNAAHSILSSGASSSYGTFAPIFAFDLTTNAVTGVTNFYGQPAPGNLRAARLDVSGINAVSGTPGQAGSVIKIKYVLTQAGADKTFFDETFTYKSARP